VEDVLTGRLRTVRDRIAAACAAAGRAPDEVALLLATKTQQAEAVRAAVLAHHDLAPGAPLAIGENRVQELVAKQPVLAGLLRELGVPYHLIGPLQANKVNAALRHADAIDTVDSLALAHRLSERCVAAGRVLPVMVQVNVSGEATKHGAAPDEGLALARQVAALDGLRLVGFQTIGALSPDHQGVRAGYATLRTLRDAVLAGGAPGTAHATELSMGMTGDLESAIAEGATVVRIGTAVFGPRSAR
jgi:pyridoxal phosphate enzyme (YggS family)